MLYLAGNDRLMSDQRLTDDDIALLCEALSANIYITSLDLRYNSLTDTGAEHIAQLLVRMSVACRISTITTEMSLRREFPWVPWDSHGILILWEWERTREWFGGNRTE